MAYCDLLTVRFLHYTYSRSEAAALRYCKRQAKEDAAEDAQVEFDVEVVRRGKQKATLAMTVSGSGGVYLTMVSDGKRWLIDDISSELKENGLDAPYRREPAVIEGVSPDELEDFIRERQPRTLRVGCRAVESQNLGEWECVMAVKRPGRSTIKGPVLLAVAPDGSVSNTSLGGPEVDGCCIELDVD